MRILLMTAFLPLMACHASWDHDGGDAHVAQSSGTKAARTYDATGFTGVEVRGSDDVQVKAADAFSVRAEGDSKILDQLEIAVVNGQLRIGRKGESSHWSWGNHGDDGVKIYVTMPHLNSASVAGAGNLDADRGEGDFKGAIAGSGNLTVAALQGGAVDLDIAGSGNLKVAGTAASLNASIAGSGDIDAKALTAASARVSIAGSGNVRGTVNGEADVSLIGSGDAELGGGAKCKVSSMGSGDARCT
ncbi:MAG: head GIN domain-containing protein [Pseudomonadota bacterium]